MRARLLLSAFVLLGLAACGPGPRYFFDNAYYATPHSVRVRYLADLREHHGLMTGSWVIANWWGDRDGEPMMLKTEELHAWALDADGDGATDTFGAEPRDDLRFRQVLDGSEIWLRGIPLGQGGATASLEAIAHAYLARVQANQEPHVDLDWPRVRPGSTTLDAEGPVLVGGQPGWEVRAHSFARRFALVFFRPGAHGWRPSEVHGEGARREYPLLLVAGFVAWTNGGGYEAHRGDFDSFLSRIDVAPERPEGR